MRLGFALPTNHLPARSSEGRPVDGGIILVAEWRIAASRRRWSYVLRNLTSGHKALILGPAIEQRQLHMRLIPPNGTPRSVWGVEIKFLGAICGIRNITMSLLRLRRVSSYLAGAALGSRTDIYSFCLISLLYVRYFRYLADTFNSI
jgi:hypothetical protein